MFKQKSDPASAGLSPADAVQQARTRARQRLVGAIVLLGIGVIAFPIVFESQPRPIPVDIPIEIPKKDGVPPLVAPPRPGPAVAPADVPAKDEMITESRSDSGRDVGAKPRVAASAAESAASRSTPAAPSVRTAPVAAASPVAGAASVPERRVVMPAPSTAVAPPEAKSDDGARARALLEGRPVAADAQQRFVVQVGAFADADAARETRRKVEKLGLRTYTQVAQTSSGSRIRVRVGPFASRDDAEAAQAKAKAAGVDAVVLVL